jgi:biopolymer transport protein ExbB/TolQ
MKRKTRLIAWLVAGVVLAMGPLWGLIGTVVAMLLAFGRIYEGDEPQAEALAGDVSLAIYTSAVGWIVCPVGLVIVIVAALRLSRLNRAPASPDH